MSLPLNQVVIGDCVEVMRNWPADSIDLVVTSPPYWGLRDYGSETVRIWGGDQCEHEWISDNTKFTHGDQSGLPKYVRADTGKPTGGAKKHPQIKEDLEKVKPSDFCSKCGAWRGSLGLEPHPQMFVDHLVEICREIKRVLKPSGTFWCNIGDTYYGSGGKGGQYEKFMPEKGQPDHYRQSSKTRSNWLQPKQKLMIPARVAIALQHDGWLLRNSICWWKPNAMPSSVKDRLSNAYENVFLFAKRRRYYFDLDAIRVPHSASTIQRITQPNVMNQPGGDKQRKLRGEGGGNASRSADMVKSLARNYEDWYFEEREKKSWHDHEHDETMGFGQQKRGFKVKNIPHPRGKNPADVWRIPTRPFPAAHFATFPPALIEPIIKAGSPRWICSKCGKPRTRITKNPLYEKFKIDNWTKMEDEKIDKYDSKFSERQGVHSQSRSLGAYRNWLREHGLGEFESGAPTETVGWSDCGCREKWIPGVVMDPFCGSGTALRVARRLGRRFIGIDIVPEYVEMARRRIRGDKYREPPEGVTPLTQNMEAEE